MPREYKTIVCIGVEETKENQEKRFEYLEKVLDVDISRKKDNVLISLGASLEVPDEYFCQKSKYVGYGCIVEIPMKFNKISIITKEIYDKIICFIEYPYSTESYIKNIKEICNRNIYSEVNIVICCDNLKVLSTDFISPEKIFEKAKKEFEIYGETVLITNQDEFKNLLKMKFIKKNSFLIEREQKIKIECVKDKMNTFGIIDYPYYIITKCKEYYDMDLELEKYELYRKIFEYLNVKGTNDLWGKYTNDFLKKIFEKELISEIYIRFYECVKDILLWPKEIFESYLKSAIKEDFKKYMEKVRADRKIGLIKIEDNVEAENEYTNFLKKENIIQQGKNIFDYEIEKYFETHLKDFLIQKFENILKKVEGDLLDEKQ